MPPGGPAAPATPPPKAGSAHAHIVDALRTCSLQKRSSPDAGRAPLSYEPRLGRYGAPSAHQRATSWRYVA